MSKYIIKRVLLMLLTLFVIVTICFMLIRMLPREMPTKKDQEQAIKDRWEALGYNEPLLTQYGIYLKGIFTEGDFGTSWYVEFREPAMNVIIKRLPPTIIVNLYSFIISVPIGILFGIYAAIKKNKWQDTFISTATMIFVSVPAFVYAFLLQYFFYFKLGWFDNPTVLSLADAGGSWFSGKMLVSMIMPIIALAFGQIASLTRFTRAELTETLTSDYMLLARAKGLTRGQATARHALKNAMVPILPSILGSFIGILGGSFVIEQIFSIPGVGQVYLRSINLFDYDVFMADTIFYTVIGLLSGILTDISYGFLDPRIRMGER